jgi:hypothetical protein
LLCPLFDKLIIIRYFVFSVIEIFMSTEAVVASKFGFE